MVESPGSQSVRSFKQSLGATPGGVPTGLSRYAVNRVLYVLLQKDACKLPRSTVNEGFGANDTRSGV